jgi:hypothetical protein
MRMMLKVTFPTEVGNRVLQDGSFSRIMEETMSRLKPEAAYFVADRGRRCAMLFFECGTHRIFPRSLSRYLSAYMRRSSSCLS